MQPTFTLHKVMIYLSKIINIITIVILIFYLYDSLLQYWLHLR
jgi:hypothetical protein